MSVFAVRYTHPDSPAWRSQLEAHMKWLLAQLQARTLLASGPLQVDQPTPDAGHAALLVLRSESREALDELQWDPMFGVLQGQSSLPGMLQQAPLGALLAGIGA